MFNMASDCDGMATVAVLGIFPAFLRCYAVAVSRAWSLELPCACFTAVVLCLKWLACSTSPAWAYGPQCADANLAVVNTVPYVWVSTPCSERHGSATG
jgi:hypothetical protein